MPIEKRKLDDKTYELYNTSPGPTAPTQAPDLAAKMFEESTNPAPAPKDKPKAFQVREWRKQTRDFLKQWDKQGPSFDLVQGIEELKDSGAIWSEEDGLYSNVPLHGKQKKAMVKAHDAYMDWMQDHGYTEFDPKRGGWVKPSLADDEMNSTLHMAEEAMLAQ